MDTVIFIVCPVASLTPSRDRDNKMEIGFFRAAQCHTFAVIRGPSSLRPVPDH